MEELYLNKAECMTKCESDESNRDANMKYCPEVSLQIVRTLSFLSCWF